MEARDFSRVRLHAENITAALEKAADEFCGADFGEAVDIDGEAIIAEDENGNYVFEKD